MNTSPIPQPTLLAQPIRPTFYTLVVMYDFDYPTLQLIATMAGVEEYVVNAMFTTVAIHRADAQKVLAAFSEYAQHSYTFDDVRVALLPTFRDICTTHKLDTPKLMSLADVPCAILDMMFNGMPVSERVANIVLGVVSLETSKKYDLENVDVAIEAGVKS